MDIDRIEDVEAAVSGLAEILKNILSILQFIGVVSSLILLTLFYFYVSFHNVASDLQALYC